MSGARSDALARTSKVFHVPMPITGIDSGVFACGMGRVCIAAAAGPVGSFAPYADMVKPAPAAACARKSLRVNGRARMLTAGAIHARPVLPEQCHLLRELPEVDGFHDVTVRVLCVAAGHVD